MSSMKRALLGIIATSAMIEQTGWAQQIAPVSYDPTSPTPVKTVPKGCKEYFFDARGNFSTERMRKDECVFICVATNDKNAKRKFNAWKERNRSNAI